MKSALLLAMFSLLCAAQEFEAVSIKPGSDADARGLVGSIFEKDQYFANFVTFRNLVEAAYDVPANAQITGPDWITQARFTVQAKAAKPETKATIRVMLQHALTERFGLKLHTESHVGPAYALNVDPRGHKMKPVEYNEEDRDISMRPLVTGGIEARHATMDNVANVLSNSLLRMDRPVINVSGLPGRFDFTVAYAANGFAPLLEAPPNGDPVIFTALREIGLRLEPRELPIQTYVIDTASRTPSEN